MAVKRKYPKCEAQTELPFHLVYNLVVYKYNLFLFSSVLLCFLLSFYRSVSGLEEHQRITNLNIQPKSIAFQYVNLHVFSDSLLYLELYRMYTVLPGLLIQNFTLDSVQLFGRCAY